MPLFKVAVLDSGIPNSKDVLIEKEALSGAGEVIRYQLENEAELTEEFFNETEAVIIWHQVKLGAASLKKFKKCKIIVRNGVGFDNVDIKAAGESGIAVCNVPDYGTEEVADHALALALALLRNLFKYSGQTRAGGWDWKIGEGKLRRFSELTFGIIGLGRIGTAAALRAKAFGFKVVFYDPYLTPGVDKSLGIKRADKLEELLKDSDVISLHCPLSEDTKGMLGEKEFALMKNGVYLINTARAGVVDNNALKENLLNKKIAGERFDVAHSEPPADRELVQMENLIFTPHAAFYSAESFIECRRSSALVVRKYFEENKILNHVNGEYLK